MCGITGLVDRRRSHSPAALTSIVSAMAATLAHRGPDGRGAWIDPTTGVALGHTRLAIIDLSDAGHQPMCSGNGHFVITYNGEVYNAGELRRELQALGHGFRGHSDTEVIVEGCAAWGVRGCVERLIGMFAFATWDRRTRTLSLARDRLGIKPLYWGAFPHLFLFGSELKALRAHDGWSPEIDRDALASYIRHGYVPAPWSIYRGVHKLEAGSMLTVQPGGEPKVERYWDLQAFVAKHGGAPSQLSDDEAIAHLEALLRDAIRRRMVADVPLGAFLSGGIDSSTVVALMQTESNRPIHTFSIGFTEAQYDEAPYARAVAGHLGPTIPNSTSSPATRPRSSRDFPNGSTSRLAIPRRFQHIFWPP